MYQWMQSNGKWLMVIFGILLMVVFILPMNMLGAGSRNPVRGKMGNIEIRESDLQRYQNEWKYLQHYAFTKQAVPSDDGTTQTQWQPIGYILGDQTLAQFQRHPNMYALLVEEAKQMGVGVSKDQLNSWLENDIRTRDDSDPTKLIKPSESTDEDRLPYLRQSLADFFLVQNGFFRAASTIKASLPVRQYFLATRTQTISLDMVDFSSAPYMSKAPAPTQAQMEAQFKKYADVDPSTADSTINPFDFGYRYPDRIKLQYISVPSSSVADAALKARNKNDQTRYDWDVAAYRYYEANQSAYTTTQPSSQPSGTEVKKVVKPFKDVEDQARQGVLNDDTDKLTQSIHQRIISTMATDYLSWKNSADNHATSKAEPTSSLGVPYDSYEYLKRLAQLIQQEYGVLPTVVSTGDWQSAATLDSLPGIGVATVDSPDMGPAPFSMYAMNYDKFLPEDQRDQGMVLSLFKPSEPLKNYDDDFYLFRISAAQAAHAPANLSEVAAQVKKDIRSEEAYKIAQKDAEQFLAAARSSNSVSSAKTRKLPVISVGPLADTGQPAGIPGFAALASPVVQQRFINEAFDLLGTASHSDQHPIGLIPLQPQGMALVGQITNIQGPPFPADLVPIAESFRGMDFRRQLRSEFEKQWYNYDDLVARTDYHEVAAPAGPSPQNEQPSPPPL